MDKSYTLHLLEFYTYLRRQKDKPKSNEHVRSLETLIDQKFDILMRTTTSDEGISALMSFKHDKKIDRKKAIDRIKTDAGIDFHISNQ